MLLAFDKGLLRICKLWHASNFTLCKDKLSILFYFANLKVFTICSNYGLVYQIYQQKIEPKIQDFTQTFDNPFEVDREALIGIDSRKASRKARKKKEMFDDINDPDLKRELASGQTQLISYSES
jgi:hypothetical protein